jgi:acyl-CoA thioester hydrolase
MEGIIMNTTLISTVSDTTESATVPNDTHTLTANAVFQSAVRIYWEDTDAGGIVYHAKYLHFFERARTEWLRHFNIEQHAMKLATGGVFVVQSLQIRYALPSFLDDELIIHTVIESLENVSCTMRQKAMRHKNGEDILIADCSIRLVFIDSSSSQPIKMPALVYDALHPLLPIK